MFQSDDRVFAREIIAIFISKYLVPVGGKLPLPNIHSAWLVSHVSFDGLGTGLKYACSHGWLIEDVDTDSYELTSIGQSEV